MEMLKKEWDVSIPPISVFPGDFETRGQGACLTEMVGALPSCCFGQQRSFSRAPIPSPQGQLTLAGRRTQWTWWPRTRRDPSLGKCPGWGQWGWRGRCMGDGGRGWERGPVALVLVLAGRSNGKEAQPSQGSSQDQGSQGRNRTGESKASRPSGSISPPPPRSTFNTLGPPASTGVTAPWVPREQTPVGL